MPASYLKPGPRAKMFGAFVLLDVKIPSPKDFFTFNARDHYAIV